MGDISSTEIDLIVTDLSMPEMDGLEFIQRVKKRLPDVPVILITAHGTIESAIDATRAGAYSYVVKPLS
ncbi:MAG: response regulator [Bdellovibrionales bacterium]